MNAYKYSRFSKLQTSFGKVVNLLLFKYLHYYPQIIFKLNIYIFLIINLFI